MEHKTKITLFATTDLNFDQRLQRIANSLQTNGYEVVLIGRVLKKSPALQQKDFVQKRFNCWFNKGILFYAEFNFRTFLYLVSDKSDIVTANDLDSVLGVYLGSRFKKETSLVFDAHEYFTEVPELKKGSLKKKIWSWVEKTFVPKFDSHYTVNKSLAHIFKEKLNLDFDVVRNISLEVKSKKRYKKNQERFILYQGALNKGRGLEALIKALPKLNFPLVIAGDGDITNELKQLGESLQLGDKLIFKGKLEPKVLRELTEQAYIGVNLLENTSLNYYYSLANKFFDYMHAEIPQISMNFPEYKLLNKEFEVAVLVKNLDDAAIVNAFKKLEDENYYKKLKANCKPMKKVYNWQKEEDKLISIYRKIKSPE